jgi:hypothetical protein
MGAAACQHAVLGNMVVLLYAEEFEESEETR